MEMPDLLILRQILAYVMKFELSSLILVNKMLLMFQVFKVGRGL